MAEIRLNKLIKQFNIGLATHVDFLNENGANVVFSPNSKVSDVYLPLLEEKFGKDLALRAAAQKTDVRISQILEKTAKMRAEKEAEAMMTVRANKLMRQYNVGQGDLISFLNEQGAGLELHPNTKVPTSFLPAIQEKFGVDKTTETKKAALHSSISPEEYDWDAFENGSPAGENREEVAAQYDLTLQKVTENDVVEGVVTSINKREVVVNIGTRSEGVIAAP